MASSAIRWGLAVVATLLAEIILIALSFVWVAVYSYTIRTGETQAFYEAFARVSAPWVSLIAGAPVFFLLARWIRRRAASAAVGTVMTMVGLYVVIEVAVTLLWPGDTSGALPFMIGGFVLKAAGAWLGVGGLAARAVADSAA